MGLSVFTLSLGVIGMVWIDRYEDLSPSSAAALSRWPKIRTQPHAQKRRHRTGSRRPAGRATSPRPRTCRSGLRWPAPSGSCWSAGGYLSQHLAASLVPFLTHAGDLSLQGGGGVCAAPGDGRRGADPGQRTAGRGLGRRLGNVVQHGFLWSPSKLAPDLSKLNPLTGFKRMFGVDSLVQFIKTLSKVLCVGAVAWFVLKPHAQELSNLAAMDARAIFPAAAVLLKGLFFAILALLRPAVGSSGTSAGSFSRTRP